MTEVAMRESVGFKKVIPPVSNDWNDQIWSDLRAVNSQRFGSSYW